MSNNEAEFTEENTDDLDENLDTEKVLEDTGSDLDSVEGLQSALKLCKEESRNYLDGWQRSKADFVNLKKRVADDATKNASRATERFIDSLLPTLDSFDMAFKDKNAWEQAPEQWRKGVEYIYGQLQSVLDTYGVTTVGIVGEEFNHDIHEPIETITVSTEAEDNTIQEVVRSGYVINETVIRPAHVKVGNFSTEQ